MTLGAGYLSLVDTLAATCQIHSSFPHYWIKVIISSREAMDQTVKENSYVMIAIEMAKKGSVN